MWIDTHVVYRHWRADVIYSHPVRLPVYEYKENTHFWRKYPDTFELFYFLHNISLVFKCVTTNIFFIILYITMLKMYGIFQNVLVVFLLPHHQMELENGDKTLCYSLPCRLLLPVCTVVVLSNKQAHTQIYHI